MLGIDLRTARAAWTILLIALLVATAYAIRETLTVVIIALLFAYLLSPAVNFLENRLPSRVSRGLALGIVYLLFVGGLVGVGFFIGGRIAGEASSLANSLPKFFSNSNWIQRIPLPVWLEPMRDQFIHAIQRQLTAGGSDLVPYLTNAGSKVLSGFNALLFIVLVPIMGFFFLKDGDKLRQDFLEDLGRQGSPARTRVLAEEILNDVHSLLGQYIRALVLLSLASFTVYTIFLTVTGAPFSVLLGGMAGMFEFIPVVGPLAAGVIILVVSGLAGYSHIIGFVIFWICYRLVQDYIISPYLMSAGVELHPLLVLFGVLAGEQIAGIPGMFLSVPALATLRVVYVRARRNRARRDLSPVVSS